MQIGWIDPADGKKKTFEEVLAEAEAYGSWAGWPYEVLLGIYQQTKGEHRPDGISVTNLLGCARRFHLEKLEDFYGTVESNYAAFRGVIAHSMLEKFKADHTIVERRFWRTYRGIPISGQMDYIGLTMNGIADPGPFLTEWLDWCDKAFEAEQNGTELPPQPEIPRGAKFVIRDWKTKDELPTYQYVPLQYQKQGNLYRWLLRLPPKKVQIEFVFVSMKGVRIMPLYAGGVYSNGRAKPNQIWTDREVEQFLEDRLVVLHLSEKLDKPLPYAMVPEEDLWACAKFCPAKELCYRLAAREQLAAFKKGEAPDRIVPREPKSRKK